MKSSLPKTNLDSDRVRDLNQIKTSKFQIHSPKSLDHAVSVWWALASCLVSDNKQDLLIAVLAHHKDLRHQISHKHLEFSLQQVEAL